MIVCNTSSVNLFFDLRAVVETASVKLDAKHPSERRSELGAHRAVQDEVGRTVNEDKHIPDIAQRYVDFVEHSLICGTG